MSSTEMMILFESGSEGGQPPPRAPSCHTPHTLPHCNDHTNSASGLSKLR